MIWKYVIRNIELETSHSLSFLFISSDKQKILLMRSNRKFKPIKNVLLALLLHLLPKEKREFKI